MTTVQISLPDALAQEAARAGLLEASQMERLLRDELQGVRLARLAEARARLRADPMPPMSAEEIQAEIDAFRGGLNRAPGA